MKVGKSMKAPEKALHTMKAALYASPVLLPVNPEIADFMPVSKTEALAVYSLRT